MKDALTNPESQSQMNLLVTTNYGYSMVYHDIQKNQFANMTLLPFLKYKQDLPAACEVVDFDLDCEKQNFNIILGLYSQYLVRYRENPEEQEPSGYHISDAMLLDYPIMAISKGDIFNIGINYMIVVTTRSVWVIGPKNIQKVLAYFEDN